MIIFVQLRDAEVCSYDGVFLACMIIFQSLDKAQMQQDNQFKHGQWYLVEALLAFFPPLLFI